MAAKSISEIVGLIEQAPSDEEVEGLVARYRETIVSEEGAQALTKKLEQRRDLLHEWESVANMVKRLQMRQAGSVRHDLETATQAVMAAEGAAELAKVADEHPVVFSSNFLNMLMQLHKQAASTGEAYTQNLVANRLKHLQLLHLAKTQNIEITPEKLKLIVYQILETRSFHDLLERIGEYLLTFSEAFDDVLRAIAKDGVKRGDHKLSKIADLRISVLDALRDVVEAFVAKKQVSAGPEEAIDELNKITGADEFLKVVARYPFVLGEDFIQVLTRELERARLESDEKAAKGIERRISHLQRIGEIVTALTAEPEIEPAPGE